MFYFFCHIHILSEPDRVSRVDWHDIQNCRQFFDAFAQEKGFDPTNAENWYNADLLQMNDRKVTITITIKEDES